MNCGIVKVEKLQVMWELVPSRVSLNSMAVTSSQVFAAVFFFQQFKGREYQTFKNRSEAIPKTFLPCFVAPPAGGRCLLGQCLSIRAKIAGAVFFLSF